MLDRYQDPTGGTTSRKPNEDAIEAIPGTFVQYVGAEVMLPTGDGNEKGRVKDRKRNSDGQVVGVANLNPILDTRVYAVEVPDGMVGEYAAHVIADHMLFSLSDPEGNQMLPLEAIVAHWKDGQAVRKADMYVFRDGRQNLRKTTKGWQLCVEWKDGSTTTWERLADVKEWHPVEVAEYAIAHDVQDEQAFVWWVADTIDNRNRIIAAVKQRVAKKNEKFRLIPLENCLKQAPCKWQCWLCLVCLATSHASASDQSQQLISLYFPYHLQDFSSPLPSRHPSTQYRLLPASTSVSPILQPLSL